MRRLVLQDDTVEEQAATHLPGDTVENLSSSNWKERLAAMEKFTEVCRVVARHSYMTTAVSCGACLCCGGRVNHSLLVTYPAANLSNKEALSGATAGIRHEPQIIQMFL